MAAAVGLKMYEKNREKPKGKEQFYPDFLCFFIHFLTGCVSSGKKKGYNVAITITQEGEKGMCYGLKFLITFAL